MPTLNCYRLRSQIGGVDVEDIHQVVDEGDLSYTEYGPFAGRNFSAHVLVTDNTPHPPRWASFVRAASTDIDIPQSNSPGALVLLEVPQDGALLRFGFAFGVLGRFLLANNSYDRGFGLRTALNLIYPDGATTGGSNRLRSVDSKRRGPIIVRARSQTSEASAFEEFDIDRLRDVVSAAVGVPHDRESWGERVSGGDSLRMDKSIGFDDLGDLCIRLQDVHDRDDYAANFGWIDDIQPVTDPDQRRRLEAETVRLLEDDGGEGLVLAPPEIVDWERISTFRYHFDRPQGKAKAPVVHPELRLGDYLTGLKAQGRGDDLTIARLKSWRITAVDGEGKSVRPWSVWACLVGEIELDGSTFVLDEGDFYHVRQEYMETLNAYVDAIPVAPIGLPEATATTKEEAFNQAAAQAHGYVLLDGPKRAVSLPGRTTPVEVCDLLTPDRDLVHVKRHFTSSTLSHLFAQGAVSAELLHMNGEFRQRAHDRVVEFANELTGFDFFDAPTFTPSEFRVVYAIVAAWSGRLPSEALPFFSKVNLRNAIDNLISHGFEVGLRSVDTAP